MHITLLINWHFLILLYFIQRDIEPSPNDFLEFYQTNICQVIDALWSWLGLLLNWLQLRLTCFHKWKAFIPNKAVSVSYTEHLKGCLWMLQTTQIWWTSTLNWFFSCVTQHKYLFYELKFPSWKLLLYFLFFLVCVFPEAIAEMKLLLQKHLFLCVLFFILGSLTVYLFHFFFKPAAIVTIYLTNLWVWWLIKNLSRSNENYMDSHNCSKQETQTKFSQFEKLCKNIL